MSIVQLKNNYEITVEITTNHSTDFLMCVKANLKKQHKMLFPSSLPEHCRFKLDYI